MKIRIDPLVIVEGKYDKIKLENLIDGMILATDGFGIFKNKNMKQTLRQLAEERGAIILTDSDRAGFLIRKHLHDILADCQIYDLYIPDVYGKEKRKESVSAEGKLGVEGMRDDLLQKILSAFQNADKRKKGEISEATLFEYGLFGSKDSADKRRRLQLSLGLPGRLNKNMLLKVLNSIFSKEQFIDHINSFKI